MAPKEPVPPDLWLIDGETHRFATMPDRAPIIHGHHPTARVGAIKWACATNLMGSERRVICARYQDTNNSIRSKSHGPVC
jgi:hypothetical protein